MNLINNAKRALGIPGARGAIVLKVGQSTEITDADLAAIQKNATASRWLASGLIAVDGDQPKPEAKPEPAPEPKPEPVAEKSEKPEIVHQGAGWYRVIVAGIDITQKSVRKDEAEALAAEYE